MSMTYHDKAFLAPPAKRNKRSPTDDHGIGRSPRFASIWWLAVTSAFYIALALVFIFLLS